MSGGGGGRTHCWQAPFGAMLGGRNCQDEAWRALNSQQGHASSVFWRLLIVSAQGDPALLLSTAIADCYSSDTSGSATINASVPRRLSAAVRYFARMLGVKIGAMLVLYLTI